MKESTYDRISLPKSNKTKESTLKENELSKINKQVADQSIEDKDMFERVSES